MLTNATTSSLSLQLVSLERQFASSSLTDVTGDPGGTLRIAISRKLDELETAFRQNAAMALPSYDDDMRDALVRYRLTQADLEAKLARRSYLASQLSDF